MLFRDRFDAGESLAEKLAAFRGRADVLVLALPRGGVPVAFAVARILQLELDVFLVRKLGVPGHEELAMGAIASGGIIVINDDVVRTLRIPDSVIDSVAESERAELQRREALYRGNRPPLDVRRRTILLIDDGLATGSSMRAAVVALRRLQPGSIVVAVPVAAADVCAEFDRVADNTICAQTPEPFCAVGRWYEDFSQTSDELVRDLLDQAAQLQLSKRESANP
jgi:predicted phosphoribosyltransferase